MFFKNPLEKYASSLSSNFLRAINGPYFCKSLREISKARYEDIATQPENEVYLVGKRSDREDEMLNATLTEDQLFYRQNGYVIKRNFIPHDLIAEYLELRKKLNLGDAGFGTPVSYVEHPEIRRIALFPELVKLFRDLHGMDMGLLVTHTRHRSTERGWHPDGYLDAAEALPRAGVWFALDDIDPRSGPFEYIAGSHRWKMVNNQMLNTFLKPEYRWPQAHFGAQKGELTWGGIVEAIIDPIVMKKIEQENLKVESFCPTKGDVLIWHGRLIHRGAVPEVRGLSRPSIIGQYVPLHEKGRGMFMRNPEGGFFLVRPSLHDAVKF
ncbi:phytanoyl-CoA dioxygenase family protein [Parasedimentitalea marina]|nr:phytanoyl-CoA dioxygenase family protein [Parasedimentitalea marina]